MVPQSPSPTLLSHSFRLSLRLIIAVALASIAASRIHPCLLSSWDGAKICRRITNHDNWGTANAYASVIKDKKMQNSLESSVKRDNDNRAHGFPILWIWHWETETKQYHITAWNKKITPITPTEPANSYLHFLHASTLDHRWTDGLRKQIAKIQIGNLFYLVILNWRWWW